MTGPVFLEGDRINLRTVEEEDLEFLRDVRNLPEIREGLSIRFPVNLEQEKDFFEKISAADSEQIHLLITREEEKLGYISMSPVSRYNGHGELALWMKPEAQGQGYATEASEMVIDHAFRELRYHKITAKAKDNNPSSKRIWEKLGLTHEGTRRDHVYGNGEYHDLQVYGILSDEWL